MADFWSQVVKTSSCWHWQGAVNNKGYGVFAYGGRQMFAQRAAYLLTGNTLELGQHLHQACNTPDCVNPSHMVVGAKPKKKPHTQNRIRGEKHPWSKLTSETVVQIRQEYASGDTSYTQLAKKYAMSVSALAAIIKRRSWKAV